MSTTQTFQMDPEISALGGEIADLGRRCASADLSQRHEGTGPTVEGANADDAITRESLIAALQTLLIKAQGPTRTLLDMTNTGRVRLSVMRVVIHYNLAALVPETGAIAMHELAAKAGVDWSRLERVLRFAFSQGVFQEQAPDSGRVSHTALSRAIPPVADWIMWTLCRTVILPDLYLSEALRSNLSLADRPTAARLALGRDFWDEVQFQSQNGEFYAGMKSLSHAQRLCRGDSVGDVFSWQTEPNSVVIDVGGGDGQTAIDAARKNPHVRFLVQDVADSRPRFLQRVPTDLATRVTFQVHDFFTPQPWAEDLPVTFFLKLILHDWPDDDCVHILENLLPLLKRAGSRLLIADYLLSDSAHVRAMDLTMMALFNSRERTLEDFKTLPAQVDQGLEIVKVWKSEEWSLEIIEVTFSS